MRISPTRISSTRRPEGFTLIELLLVMTVLSAVMFISVPTFQDLLQNRVDREVKRLGGVIRLVRNEAILTRRTFRLMFDLKQGTYSVQESQQGKFIERDDPKLFRLHTFPKSFRIRDITVFGNRFERRRDQTVPVLVNASGFVDPFSLRFKDDGQPWTLQVTGFAARMKLNKGFTRFDREDL